MSWECKLRGPAKGELDIGEDQKLKGCQDKSAAVLESKVTGRRFLLKLMLALVSTIFLVEFMIMVFLHYFFPRLSAGWTMFLDGLILTALVAILFYLSTYRSIFMKLIEYKHADERLRESEEMFRATFNQAAVGIVHAAPDGQWLRVNQKFCDIVGYSREEVIRLRFRDITHPDDIAGDEANVKRLLAGEIGTFSMEKRYIHKNGSIVWVNLTVSQVYDHIGRLKYLIGVIEDITARKQTEECLVKSEENYRDLFENMNDLVMSCDMAGNILYVNRAWEKAVGYTRVELETLALPEIIHQDSLTACNENLSRLTSGEIINRMEMTFVAKDGRFIETEGNVNCRFEKGRPTATRGIFRDVTERKEQERMIKQLAYYDSLTGLPNRALFRDRLMVALAGAERDKVKLALVFLDLDGFKDVNDNLGHAVGDKLLQEVAQRLAGLLRRSDTVARMGGDEFLIILPGLIREDQATEVARKVLAELQQPFVVDRHTLSITSSIGVCIFPEGGKDEEALLRNADIAMYKVKRQGGNDYLLFAG